MRCAVSFRKKDRRAAPFTRNRPAAGTVQFVGPVKGWGVIVILRLAGGYHLVLAGLERTSIENGQSVAAGTAVGRMPDRGKSTPDLYIEVRRQGAAVDPARWLDLPPQKTAARE